jgi:acetyltransferase-like isoleucine patch superfamily enzyme
VRAYVVATGIRISPFGDLVRDLPVGGVALSEWQAALFRKFGFEVVHVERSEDIPQNEPRIVTRDNVFFTRRILKSLLSRWLDERHRASRVALPRSSCLLRTFSALQDYAVDGDHALFDLWALPSDAALETARPLPVLFKEKVITYPVPQYLTPVPQYLTGVERWEHPITSSVCMHLSHWLHVLQANRLAIQIRWVDTVVAHPLWTFGAILPALIPGRGRLIWRIAARMNRVGRNADIHPTARLEGCLIGDDVRIGAQALVRASIIGSGSVIEERTNVSFSVIGERNFVSKNSLVYASAAFDDANLGMIGMQMCLAGRRAALTPRATATDVKFGSKITVKVAGEVRELDVPLLGACFGHDTYLGADLYIAPGREIPNGVRLGPQPERVLSSIPDDLEPGRAYTVRDGKISDP